MKQLLTFLIGLFFVLTAWTQNNTEAYFEGELIVKIKSKYGQKCNKSAIAIPRIYDIVKKNKIYQTEKLFPRHQAVKEKKLNQGWVDLSTIYTFRFDKSTDPKKIIAQLEKEEAVEYAELNYENVLAYSPSDTAKHRQWYLDAIDVFDAWDIEKGDTNVVIAIVDTGSDMDHEDMIDDFAYNYDDPINGIDDDNDGYIDNFNGWDVANNDNDPSLGAWGHGMNCAGIASASTDNVTGISGVGFNTKILTVRIDDDASSRLTGAYPGIVYAADQGADIINNSWGSNTYSRFSQDIVNYAAINRGSLVIGAVGNFGEEKLFYPAAYDNVLSVGSTIPNDTVKANSNFGYWIDIMAPGEWMHTTGAKNSYHGNGGTSMAGPVVAGVAALVKSQFPNYTAKQIHHQILNSADDIEPINDSKYKGKIGVGRVNAYKAVSQTSLAGIEFENISLDDGDNQLFSSGDEITIRGIFKNYLADATNVNVNIREVNDKASIVQGKMTFSSIAQFAEEFDSANPFKIKLNQGLPLNSELVIEVHITADNFDRKQYIPLVANPDYITVRENELTVTLTSNGSIGFPNSDLGEGIGLLDDGSQLYEGGFIIGNSADYTLNRFRGQDKFDEDFAVEKSIVVDQATKADYETSAIFNDGNYSQTGKLRILQKNYFFTNDDNKRSVIYVFAVQNTSQSDINGLYAGLMLDWDIYDFSRNKVNYDAQRKMGYSYSTDTNIYCGVKVLTSNLGNTHYAIDNVSDSGGGINAADGITDLEKWLTISTNKNEAGTSSAIGNDIIDVNAIGPFNLKPDESKTVSFAIILGNSLSEIQIEADASQKIFDDRGLTNLTIPRDVLPTEKKLLIYPNPAQEHINIELKLDEFAKLDLEVYDIQGRLILERRNQAYSRGVHQIQLDAESLKTGIYFLEMKNDNIHFKNKFVIAPQR